MHMSTARPLLFARRPAPVQVAWLAYPGTTGLSSIGYRFTDPWLDPLGDTARTRYSEKSIRLADTLLVLRPVTAMELGQRIAVADNGHVTFGCLNNLQGQRSRAAASGRGSCGGAGLAAVLLGPAGVARRRPWQSLDGEGHRSAQRMEFRADPATSNSICDVSRHRSRASTRSPTTATPRASTRSGWACRWPQPLARRRRPAPVIRCFPISASPNWQANEQGFVETAVALSLNRPRLRELRAELRQRMRDSALMDGARFARAIEHGFVTAWKDWLATA